MSHSVFVVFVFRFLDAYMYIYVNFLIFDRQKFVWQGVNLLVCNHNMMMSIMKK